MGGNEKAKEAMGKQWENKGKAMGEGDGRVVETAVWGLCSTRSADEEV